MARRVLEPLRAAVLAAPDDEGPRLVLADWWLERGDPRGELVTLQMKLQGPRFKPPWRTIESRLRFSNQRAFSLPLSGTPNVMTDDKRRIYSLLDANAARWTAELAGDVINAYHGFRHGFIEALAIDADDFVPRMERIFALEPVRYLRLRKLNQKNAEAIFSNALMQRIRLLSIGGPTSSKVDTILERTKNLAADVKRF